jgi:hypothetical protein
MSTKTCFHFHQARYQKERAANRRNEILLDQLCTEIEVKAVAVQNQQVLSHSALVHIDGHLTRRVLGMSAHIPAMFSCFGVSSSAVYVQSLLILKARAPTGGVRAGEGGVREHDALAGGVRGREAGAGGAPGAGRCRHRA